MREIKFRAYDNRLGIMRPPVDIWHCGSDGEYGEYWGEKWGFNWTEQTIMQYTGLKDKNGVEIYEGDIVQNINCFGCSTSYGDGQDIDPQRRQIVWDEENVCFAWGYLNLSWKNRRPSGYCLSKSNEKEFEIIGNIYENPELLNRHC